MNSSREFSKRHWTAFVVAGAFLIAGCTCACRDKNSAPQGEAAAPGAEAAPAAPAGGDAAAPAAGGMKAYVDPETGKFTDTPPPGAEPLPGDVVMPQGTVVERPAAGGASVLDMRGGKPQTDPAE